MKKNIKILLFIFFGVFSLFCILSLVFSNHKEVNNPNQVVFQQYLKRDLSAYFKSTLQSENNLEYVFLSDSSSQSGLAYPKYYLWVTIKDDKSKILGKYLVRVSAMDKEEFYVTDSFTLEDIKSNPNSLKNIFPDDVIEKMNEILK